MQRKLKTILRKSFPPTKDDSKSTRVEAKGQTRPRAHTEIRTVPPAARSRKSSASRDTYPSGHTAKSSYDTRGLPFPPGSEATPPIAIADNARPGHSPPSTDHVNDAVADEYAAYLPALSSRQSHEDEHMSLGGDRRHVVGVAESKHSEGVANRNIEMYGSSSAGFRHGSLPSQTNVEDTQTHKGTTGSDTRRFSSVESTRAPASLSSTVSKNSYVLGTGVPTEGGLIDSIRPHVETAHSPANTRANFPARIPRDDPSRSLGRRKRSDSSDYNAHQPRKEVLDASEMLLENGKVAARRNGSTYLGQASFDGDRAPGNVKDLFDGVLDLRDTEDTDTTVRWAPAVTHETIKSTEHHIYEEKIYREIHNYDVYHRIQPVYETEILPAKHFIHDANGKLVEVSEEELPDCTGDNQRWFIGERPLPKGDASPRFPRVKELTVISDKTYMSSEGYERRETTILHPPQLADLSDYKGLVLPIEFLHHPDTTEVDQHARKERALNHLGDTPPFSLKELRAQLPITSSPSAAHRESSMYSGSTATRVEGYVEPTSSMLDV